jgi:hypothetical protein
VRCFVINRRPLALQRLFGCPAVVVLKVEHQLGHGLERFFANEMRAAGCFAIVQPVMVLLLDVLLPRGPIEKLPHSSLGREHFVAETPEAQARRRQGLGVDERITLTRKRLWTVEVRLAMFNPGLLARYPLAAQEAVLCEAAFGIVPGCASAESLVATVDVPPSLDGWFAVSPQLAPVHKDRKGKGHELILFTLSLATAHLWFQARPAFDFKL